MKICPVGVMLFHVDSRTDRRTPVNRDWQTNRHTWRRKQSLFAILQMCLKIIFHCKQKRSPSELPLQSNNSTDYQNLSVNTLYPWYKKKSLCLKTPVIVFDLQREEKSWCKNYQTFSRSTFHFLNICSSTL